MNRSKRSPIWKMTKENFSKLIADSKTYRDVLSIFGLGQHGNNHNTIRRRCDEEQIDISHFRMNATLSRNEILTKLNSPKSLDEVQIENSTYSRSTLKQRLLKEGLLENKCAVCGLADIWNSKPIVLILDHKNGIPNDHRMENLQLVCPNCNSQLDTFAGKHKRKRDKKNCIGCGKILAKRSTTDSCLSCAMSKRRKVIWPTAVELLLEVAESSKSAVAKRLGVSETAVRKMLKRQEKVL